MDTNKLLYESPNITVIAVKMERGLLYVSGEAGDKNVYNDQGEY